MENFDIYDYVAIFKRHKVAYVVTTLVFLVLSLTVTFTWSRYRAEATIQVQQPDIPQEMTAPLGVQAATIIRALADQRIEQIEQRVTSSSSLIEIITKFNLYPKERKTQPLTIVVEKMRKKIKLELLSSDLANPTASSRMDAGQLAAIAFTVSFDYDDPLLAQHTTNEIMSRILDEDIKERRGQAKETSDFLGAQVGALEKTMAEQEKKLAEFKGAHPSIRPETIPIMQQELQMVQMTLQQVQSQTEAIDRSRGDIRAQLAAVDPYSRVVADGQVLTTAAIQLKALQAKYSTLTTQYGPDHPDVAKLRHQIEALQAEVGQAPDTAILASQIKDARANLAAAERTQGADNPDVLALRRQVRGLEEQMATQAHDPTPHDEIKKDADNPAYLMLVAQLKSTDDQYRGLLAQQASLQKQYETLQKGVSETPMVERELEELSRDYDNAQLRYRELKEKKLSADMSEQMEQGRTAERLVVLDPPELPVDTHPRRFLLFVASIFFSGLSGLGGVALAENLSRSVHGPRHLADLTGDLPLVVIPHIFTRNEIQENRRKRRRNAVIALAVVAGSFLIFNEFVMPLDVLWSLIANRLGMAS